MLTKKRKLLLSALAMSVGLSLSTIPSTSMAALPAVISSGEALPSLAPMLEKVLPAVVSVHVSGTRVQNQQVPDEFKFFFGPNFPSQQQSTRPFEGLGSGVIIDAEKGYVLTNNHVVDGADKIQLQINDGREFTAKLIGSDPQTDIALLQIEKPSNLTAIKMADSDHLRVGDFAVAVGNPFGLGQTATSGIISALGRSGLNLEGLENFIQTDASINRGNSGGALVNLNGELIGINTAILAPGGGNIGIGFAIPSNMARDLSQQLITHGEVKRGILGIRGTEMNADIAKSFKIDAQRGAFVSEVFPDSSAAKAGIKPGDVLISVDGKRINSFAELRAKVGTTPPGKEITIGLIRQGKPMDVKVTLEKQSGDATRADNITPALQGAVLSNYSDKQMKGVMVDSVEKGSLAAGAGLQKGDIIIGINREAIKSIGDVRKEIEKKEPIIALNIKRGNEEIYLMLRNTAR